jgi:hypothetical protein
MELHITTHTFRTDGEWETIDTLWYSPFFYWQLNGLRVTPPLPLRIVTGFGRVVRESDAGWINTGGASAMLLQRTQARGKKGQTIRVEVGEEIEDEEPAREGAALEG